MNSIQDLLPELQAKRRRRREKKEMKIRHYCNCRQEAEAQIFMFHGGNLTLISTQQSFRGGIYLSSLDLWMSHSFTLTFYFIIFRSVKAEIQICSSFTTLIVFNQAGHSE